MDGDSTLLLILFFCFMLTNAFFSCAESAFSCVNKVRLRSRADGGEKRAQTALYIVDHFDDAITTVLIGINIASIAAASIATVFVSRLFTGVANINTYSTLVTTLVMFLFAEMIPKTLANDRSDSVALACAPLLRFSMKLFRPLAIVFTAVANLAKKIFGKNETPSITEEELYDILETVGEEGVVDEEQSDLMMSAMEFSETTASDVMTMRDDIYYLDLRQPREQLLETIRKTTHSRIPVCDGDLDHIIGVLQLRWFLKAFVDHREANIRKLIRKNSTRPTFIGEDAKIDELLETMRQKRIMMAFVVDENRHIEGLVTIEDFLEELVGEIWDEDDVVDEHFYSLGGNRYAADPALKLGEAMRRMKRTIKGTPLGRYASKTLEAFFRENLGDEMEEDSAFVKYLYEFTVEDTNEDGSLKQVVIRIVDPDENLPEGRVES